MNRFNLVSWKEKVEVGKVGSNVGGGIGGDVGGDVDGDVDGGVDGNVGGGVSGEVGEGRAILQEGEVAEPRTDIGGAIKTKNSERAPETSLSGKVAGLLGPLAGLAGLVETSALLTGPAGPVKGRTALSADSGRISGETRLAVGRNGCHKCKSGHHFALSNEVKIWVEAEVKRGKTLDGTQAKRGIKFLENSKKSPGFKEAATVFKGNV